MSTIYLLLIVATFSIIINVFCYRASKNIKDKKKLRFRSRVMLTISLVALAFTILITILAIIEINKLPTTPLGIAMADVGARILYGFLLITVSSILLIVFLPFLITSILLRRLSRGTSKRTTNAPVRRRKEYTDDSF